LREDRSRLREVGCEGRSCGRKEEEEERRWERELEGTNRGVRGRRRRLRAETLEEFESDQAGDLLWHLGDGLGVQPSKPRPAAPPVDRPTAGSGQAIHRPTLPCSMDWELGRRASLVRGITYDGRCETRVGAT
jgi:hypothetical protein